MAHIAEQLLEHSTALKNLNLSYNPLSFKPNTREQTFSRNFVKNINEFLKLASKLNHIDLSGLQLPKEQLLYLSETMSTCPNLMAIHLNDSGIISPWDDELLDEMRDIFELGEIGVAETCDVNLNGDSEQAGELEENRELGLSD